MGVDKDILDHQLDLKFGLGGGGGGGGGVGVRTWSG